MVGPCSPPSATPSRGTSPSPSPDSGSSSSATAPRARLQSANRGARRHRGLEGAVVQGGEGPPRRGQRIAWRAKRPPRSSRRRRRPCTPSPYARAEALGLEAESFPCACVKPIVEPALHASPGRPTPFTPSAIGLATRRIRRGAGRLWQGGDGGISAFCRTRKHPRSTSRTTFVVRTRRREFRDSSLMRTPARSRPELESPRARVPYTPGCELPLGTWLRAGARVNYWNRSPGAYGHRRSSAGTPRS